MSSPINAYKVLTALVRDSVIEIVDQDAMDELFTIWTNQYSSGTVRFIDIFIHSSVRRFLKFDFDTVASKLETYGFDMRQSEITLDSFFPGMICIVPEYP